MEIAVTLLVAAVGGLIGYKLRFPAGFMVGALLASGVLSLLWGGADCPVEARVPLQIAAGAYIGMSITRANLNQLKKMIGPSLALFGGVVFFALTFGFLVYFVSDLSLVTSLLATVPGGIIDMSLISLELGAEPGIVAALQLLRLVFIMAVYPFILKKILASGQQKKSVQVPIEPARPPRHYSFWDFGQTILIAAAGGTILFLIRMPAGAIVGAMAGSAFFNIKTDGRAYVPPLVKTLAQVMAGALIGTTLNPESLVLLRGIALPALLVLAECLAIGGVMGFLLWKFGRTDPATALFGSAPAGLSDMVLIAIDEGGDPSQVMLLQLVRFVGSIALFPSLIKLLVLLLSPLL